jgi:hypothetical protein
MCRRTREAGNLTVAFRTGHGAGRPSGACRWFALAALLALTARSAQAQPQGVTSPTYLPPAPSQTSVPPAAPVPLPPPGPAPGCGCAGHNLEVPAADVHWGFYAETGPLFPVGGTLARHLDNGWAVAGGVREWMNCKNGAFFAELAGEYATTGVTPGVQETAINVFFPDAAIRTINNFYLTDLTSFQQFGIHGALGWNYSPNLFGGTEDEPDEARPFYLTGRLGFRGGGMNAGYLQMPTPSGLTVLNGFNGQHDNPTNNPAKIRIVDQVQRNEPYYGPFATFGVGLKWHDAHLGEFHLGDIYLTAEVELSYEATDLGSYLHEAYLLSVSPTLSLSIAF